jgi:hypothetical protein
MSYQEYLNKFLKESITEDFKVGDEVKITLQGLQKQAKSIPGHIGYSRETMSWRKKLSEFYDNETIGKITEIYTKNKEIQTLKAKTSNGGFVPQSIVYNLDVDFDGELVQVPSYMVTKVN